jgi:hypothetical protein
MDELFGSAGFAAADLALKARIEREIGLSALLGDDDNYDRAGDIFATEKPHDSSEEKLETKDEGRTIQ